MSSAIFDSHKEIGVLGALSPNILEEIGIEEDVFIFSIDTDLLKTKSIEKFTKFSKFPSIQRDLSFVLDKNITSDKLSALLMNTGGKHLKNLNIFDVYEGKGIDEGKKSIALTLTWQSSTGTLLDTDIDMVVEKIVNSVNQHLGGNLRN